MTNSRVTKSKTTAEELEALFQALGDRTRLRLLNLMADGEVCVCFFVEVLDEPQPKISRHLAYLRSAGLVNTSRDGKWISYSIAPPEHPTVRAAFDAVMATFKEDRELQRDRAALARSCCSPRVPEQLRRAPRPAIANAEHVAT
ncbi:MAG: metalloregulator ArsR/SmtB family transcription factor [Acidobacteria bacterium]|nr:metalloregulator ArsR/SmtB family transcription factor [Acidobacteriota bacterium]MBV9069420.1 metalloregulator ArsR/SmtB family transcription factor [Acidobacteriota bacterium]MBV9187664.1 metalloregulator ArsR/SmtB family transcription factor [Acidobacteriota bacterium]